MPAIVLAVSVPSTSAVLPVTETVIARLLVSKFVSLFPASSTTFTTNGAVERAIGVNVADGSPLRSASPSNVDGMDTSRAYAVPGQISIGKSTSTKPSERNLITIGSVFSVDSGNWKMMSSKTTSPFASIPFEWISGCVASHVATALVTVPMHGLLLLTSNTASIFPVQLDSSGRHVGS